MGYPGGCSSKTTIDNIVTSVAGITTSLEVVTDHIHSTQRVYPDLATGVLVTAQTTAWVLGATAQLVAASTITSPFDIHHVDVYDISNAGRYQLNIYHTTCVAGNLMCSTTFSKASVTADNYIRVPVVTPKVAANLAVKAKLACSGGGAFTSVVKIWYHTY